MKHDAVGPVIEYLNYTASEPLQDPAIKGIWLAAVLIIVFVIIRLSSMHYNRRERAPLGKNNIGRGR
ncbi:hypothetical protein [Paenibacillus sp. SAFN-117]|uniref:hypothetical protein n=1 Tax=Paenibacillus sp. SAFN-117 TaxID=3436860 RepID=UPI00124695C0|nr:hypothetical protein [Aneurinibacillus sp. XH2]